MSKRTQELVRRRYRKQWYDNDDNGDPGSGDPGSGGDEKTFTQEDVNRFLAEDRRKHTAKLEQTLEDLKSLKENKDLTEQQLAEITERATNLENSLKTKEQLAKEEKVKLEKKMKGELESEKQKSQLWQKLYTDSTINSDLLTAATQFEAVSPEQIVALLKTNTRLVEEADEAGKPTGRFVSRVKYTDTDESGKPIEIEISPKEAVKRMSETPKRFGNLFKTTLKSGLGGSGDQSKGGFASGSQESYKEQRKSIVK